MKLGSILEKVFTVFVGGLFVFSGLVKLNDPVGTAIKFEEYFDVFSVDFSTAFEWFIPFALPLAVLFCVAEVIAGLALLVNFKKRTTLLSLLALILFFTFLTFYSAYFNKVTDCGCFGDAIPLDPWQSFYKDLVLLAMILFMVMRLQKMSNATTKLKTISMITATLVCFGLGIYAIKHLPFIDFRPYKIGAHIPTLREAQVPCEYLYIMEKDGAEFTFDSYPKDPSYKFKEMKVLNEKACQPVITDYNVSNEEGDFTEETLTGTKLLLIVHNTEKASSESFKEINPLIAGLEAQGVMTMALTSDAANFEDFRHLVQLAAPYYFADATVLKTIVRSNPGLVLIKDGTIKGKWHFNDTPTAGEAMKKL